MDTILYSLWHDVILIYEYDDPYNMWLVGCKYTIYLGKSHVLAIMLPNFRQKYMNYISWLSVPQVYSIMISICYVHVNVNSDSIWVSKIRIPSLGGSSKILPHELYESYEVSLFWR